MPRDGITWTSHYPYARTNRASYKIARHGWVTKDGKITGFSFGNTLFTTDGPQTTPAKSHHWYTPTGSYDEWKQAANLYVGKGLIEMETVIATGFAAPLIHFTLVDGAVVYFRSNGTGVGKTAALEAGNSLWAHRNAIIRDGTSNATMDRVATLNNLPVPYDDMVPTQYKYQQLIKDVSPRAKARPLEPQLQARQACSHLHARMLIASS